MKNRLYYLTPIVFIMKLTLLFTLFNFMNFDSNLNLDYLNYKTNYEANWKQHEVGFEFIADIAKYFSLSFDDFWIVILALQVLFLSVLYRNNLIFILAFPNLIYLSQGLLGTQVRFGLAVTFFLVLLSYFKNSRVIFFAGLVPILFHNAIVIFFVISSYMKVFFEDVREFFVRSNVWPLLFFILCILAVVLSMDFILKFLGYDYYVGTKYQQGRSLAGLLYLFVNLIFIITLLKLNAANHDDKYVTYYKDWVVISLLLLIVAILVMNSSVISGRITLVYTLIEPFILYWILIAFKDNLVKYVLFTTFLLMSYSKLLLMDLN